MLRNKEKWMARLQEILEESGLSQREFGRQVLKIEDNDSFTNDIFKGRKELSLKKAQNIVKAFPWLRIQWVLGEDDYKTEAEKMLSNFKTDYSLLQMRGEAFRILAELCGYNIYLPKEHDTEKQLDAIKQGYILQKGAEIIGHISLEKFNLLSLDLQELAEQRIKSYIREMEA